MTGLIRGLLRAFPRVFEEGPWLVQVVPWTRPGKTVATQRRRGGRLARAYLCPYDGLRLSPFQAGLGVNFWRHHLLVTSGGQARIYFNSGPYGREQMYSLVANPWRRGEFA